MIPLRKTKIVATVGPASSAPGTLAEMIAAGMNVARFNFSHGDFDAHVDALAALRQASRQAGREVTVMADLPGPKIRIGTIAAGSVILDAGRPFTLTTAEVPGSAEHATVSFGGFPDAVDSGSTIFINDGLIELEVIEVQGEDVRTRIVTGGELHSKKGVNVPGADLGISAFTRADEESLAFALAQGIDVICQSFVEGGSDVAVLKEAARRLGGSPFVVAKIERAAAVDNLEEILDAADGIMVARGDLGVELPLEETALLQKEIIARAVARGKPVIVATQMLESMTTSRRPTRAEATDAANAVLDGADAVMLSAESAAGRYPVEAVGMLSRIVTAAEKYREKKGGFGEMGGKLAGELTGEELSTPTDLIARSVAGTLRSTRAAVVVVPTVSGATARSVARFRLPVWIAAVSPSASTCRALELSYGVVPLCEPDYPGEWNSYVRRFVEGEGLEGDIALLTEGPSSRNPDANFRMELIELKKGFGK